MRAVYEAAWRLIAQYEARLRANGLPVGYDGEEVSRGWWVSWVCYFQICTLEDSNLPGVYVFESEVWSVVEISEKLCDLFEIRCAFEIRCVAFDYARYFPGDTC